MILEDSEQILLELINERQKLKEMVKETHNDMDLGRQVRNYLTNQSIYNKKV
jgi:hypothetical protein